MVKVNAALAMLVALVALLSMVACTVDGAGVADVVREIRAGNAICETPDCMDVEPDKLD